MDAERKKQLACDFLHALGAHDAERGADLLHDELVYWTCGKKHLFPYAGERNKADFVAYLRTPTIFVGGSKLTPVVFTGEDDRLAVTVEGRGELPDGRIYTNEYHYLFRFRDGRIVEVREYMDTQAAAEFFGF